VPWEFEFSFPGSLIYTFLFQGYCREHKLPLSGTKAVFIERISEHRNKNP